LLALYSTRIILEALGAEDFGLYSMIGGLVATLAFLNSVMTTSTQRFLSVSLGKGNILESKRIFSNSLFLHLIIGFMVLFVVEGVGAYLIHYQLKIAVNRTDTAMYLLHFIALSTFFTIISVPYDAIITAHENMGFLAVINIIESILKFGVALVVLYYTHDKLVLYGSLLMLVSLFTVLCKRLYSRKRYTECHGDMRTDVNKPLLKELGSFAGWQLFGNLSSIARSQGTAVVLNLFFTTVVNAAYGIANQINGQLMFFTQSLLSAIRPQIMKAEGANDRDRMIRLALLANKLAYYFFAIIAIPAYFLLPIILKWWLKEVPTFTVEFCRAIIVLTLVSQLSQGVITAVQAIGKIRVYQIVAGSILLLTLPLGYLLLKIGYDAVSIIYVAMTLEIIALIFRAFYFRYLTSFPVYKYFIDIIGRAILVALFPIMISYFLNLYFEDSILKVLILSASSSIVLLACMSVFGFNTDEKVRIKNLLTKMLGSLGKKLSFNKLSNLKLK